MRWCGRTVWASPCMRRPRSRTAPCSSVGSSTCSPSASAGSVRFVAPPVLLLDVHDFFFAQAEVVTHFVNQRFADAYDDVVFISAVFENRQPEDRDFVGQHIA